MGIFGNDPQSHVDLDHLRDRVARLEAAVAALQAQVTSGGSPAADTGEPAWMVEVRSLKASGKVINAIKVYRENTGLGLKEAKDAVEALP